MHSLFPTLPLFHCYQEAGGISCPLERGWALWREGEWLSPSLPLVLSLMSCVTFDNSLASPCLVPSLCLTLATQGGRRFPGHRPLEVC